LKGSGSHGWLGIRGGYWFCFPFPKEREAPDLLALQLLQMLLLLLELLLLMLLKLLLLELLELLLLLLLLLLGAVHNGFLGQSSRCGSSCCRFGYI